MSACDFAYYKPANVDEAIDLLATLEDARPLAGGQSLMPLLFSRRVRCRSLIDLSMIDGLATVHEEPAMAVVGAMCRQAALEGWPRLRSVNPMLAAALARLGPAVVRGMGTIGGNLAVGDPTAELLPIAIAQEWRLRIQSPSGFREVPAESFMVAPYQTVLARDDLLHSIAIPAHPGEGWGIEDVRPSRTARPLAGVAAHISLEVGRVTSARVVAFATAAPPHRLRAVESCLVGEAIGDDLLDLAAQEARGAVDARDDVAAPAAWRRLAIGRLTRRALQKAARRVGAETRVPHV